MRVELQLEVSGSTNQGRAQTSESLKRFDAGLVGGHQLCQIELKGKRPRAYVEQFRNLRDTQPAGQSHEASIDLLNDADPAVHDVLRGKT